MKEWFKGKILSNNKNTLLFIATNVFVVLFIYQLLLLLNGTYFNSNSDDIVQYAPILNQYITFFKEGNFSWFNYMNGSGASSFADTYYVPIDVFSFLTFILSYIMDFNIAFSFVELIKVFLGVVTFAYFLQKSKYKNTTILFLSFMYLCVGGCWVFSVFSTYLSMFFYLPCSMLAVRYYCDGKKWILPLYGFVLILYNFYNAYSLFIFMLFVYIVKNIRDNYKNFKTLVKDSFIFGIHILLSVVMGLFVLLPSVLYIANYSIRNTIEFEFFFDMEIYFRMICKMFTYEPNSIGFMGAAGDLSGYIQNHYSCYIGIIGLYGLSFIFVMKDRVSKIYKWVIVTILIMAILPIFSMIFSGTGTAYLRWLSFINIIFIYFIGHVIENIKWQEISNKNKIINLLILGTLFLISFLYSICTINEKGIFYFSLLMVSLLFIIFYLIFYFAKQKELFNIIIFAELVSIFVINLMFPFSNQKMIKFNSVINDVNSLLNKLDINENSMERVYFTSDDEVNMSKLLNRKTNDATFHSFLPKEMYEYQYLYSNEDPNLVQNSIIKNISPSYSRTIDYKYFIVYKDYEEYRLDNLPIYYEDDKYIVYENIDYNPFYVYENYYDYNTVKNLNYKKDYLEFQKKLFKGVVLDENNYNLIKLPYNYNDSVTKSIDARNTMNLEKISEDKYISDFSWWDLEYEGSIYISGENLATINGIEIQEYEKKSSCKYEKEYYKCDFNKQINNILVDSPESVNLFYYVTIKIDEEIHVLFLGDEKINYDYFNYYVKGTESMIQLINANNEIRKCFFGICNAKNFDTKYIITPIFSMQFDAISKSDSIYIDYQEESFAYYNENKVDNYASNKSLTYKGSTINVKYERISSSDNDQVVVLPITYSEEWVCENKNYSLVVANGGYLGVIVKNGIKNIDVSITFKPRGVRIGIVGSLLGIATYLVYVSFVYYERKKVKTNEDF